MPSPSERFVEFGKTAGREWGAGVGDWITKRVAEALGNALEHILEAGQELIYGTLIELRDAPTTPAEVQDFIKSYIMPTAPDGKVIPSLFSILGAAFALTKLGEPAGRILTYMQDELIRSFRFDPAAVVTHWRRNDKPTENYFDDLREQGWSDERIETLKQISEYYPNPADLVRWQAREVFEPDMITKYGLDEELGKIQREPFYRGGMTDEQIINYWRAHWEHASWNQVLEMVRRTDPKTGKPYMTEADVWDWFRLVEIPPFWRDKLIGISWNVPTRVDVRRFWEMRTITEARLRELYTAMGYHGKDLEDYVLWTKIYTAFPDLLARYKNGWLTLEDVKAEIVAMGMSAERAQEMIEEKIKKASPERVAKDRELTAAEIIKGVKKEVITVSEGIELLMDMGYDEWEARYKIAIEVAALTGSPESYTEFKDLTMKYRQAIRKKTVPMPEDLRRTAAELVQKQKDVDDLRRAVAAEQKTLITEPALPDEVVARRKELEVALHRAESALAEVQSRYSSLVAEWKQQTR